MINSEASKEKKVKTIGRKNAPRDKKGKFDKEIIPIKMKKVKKAELTDSSESINVPYVETNNLLLNSDLNPKEKNWDDLVKHTEIDEDEKKDMELEPIDAIEFLNGKNKLTIRFSKRHNRMFRIQVFLNNTHEVRPVTYTGSSTGYAFWNLLKGALK
jgi:hypothetical protein